MRKLFLIWLLVLMVVALVFSGCASAPALPQVIRMGSSPAGLLGYVWATATGKVLSNHTPMSVKVEPYTGTSVFRELINSGELQLGWNSPSDLYDAYRSVPGSTPAPNIRMILVGPRLLKGLFVKADSGMKDIKDVKGKRVAGDFKGQAVEKIGVTGQLANAGLTWDDVKMVPVVNVKEAALGLREGRLDVAMHAVGAADVEEAKAAIPGGIRFLNLDSSPKALAAMQKIINGAEIGQISKGTGILGPTNVLLSRMVLITNKEVEEQVIYQVAKALWEYVEELYTFHQDSLGEMKQNNLVASDVAVIPYHPGAIKLFKEKGAWSSNEDTVQSALLKAGKP